MKEFKYVTIDVEITMKPVMIKPEKELKTTMFIVWGIVLVAVLAFLSPLIIFVPETSAKVVFGIFLIIFLLIMALWAFWIPAFYKTLEYYIDSGAVKMNRGVFWKRLITVPYSKITNVDVTQGPLQRMYRIGTIHVQTAGAGGAQGAQAELRLNGVRDLKGLKDIIMEGVRGHKSIQPEKTEDYINDSETLRSILKELQAIHEALEK